MTDENQYVLTEDAFEVLQDTIDKTHSQYVMATTLMCVAKVLCDKKMSSKEIMNVVKDTSDLLEKCKEFPVMDQIEEEMFQKIGVDFLDFSEYDYYNMD